MTAVSRLKGGINTQCS